ncbi:uncharacterized protein LOC126349954 [Schistocerca gregaria]|uniref:uncharacterized protein LOC126349954 n=1 Tax=Schistocerca gregaria TaxID=7010 RepID=UPI00211DBF1E|nr:uncharacterized protein LOC126349954 [Schistocerca gregaria]
MNYVAQRTDAGELKRNFFHNSMVVRALSLLFPVRDREKVRIWLSRLHRLPRQLDTAALTVHGQYMWFLKKCMQTGCLREPFRRPPPPTGQPLPPLRSVVPIDVYESVIQACKRNAKEPVLPPYNPEGTWPANFYWEQPQPVKGAVCYMAVFSDT